MHAHFTGVDAFLLYRDNGSVWIKNMLIEETKRTSLLSGWFFLIGEIRTVNYQGGVHYLGHIDMINKRNESRQRYHPISKIDLYNNKVNDHPLSLLLHISHPY